MHARCSTACKAAPCRTMLSCGKPKFASTASHVPARQSGRLVQATRPPAQGHPWPHSLKQRSASTTVGWGQPDMSLPLLVQLQQQARGAGAVSVSVPSRVPPSRAVEGSVTGGAFRIRCRQLLLCMASYEPSCRAGRPSRLGRVWRQLPGSTDNPTQSSQIIVPGWEWHPHGQPTASTAPGRWWSCRSCPHPPSPPRSCRGAQEMSEGVPSRRLL